MTLDPAALSDTIVARATAAGEGAIAVIRLSGPLSREVLSGLIRRPAAGRSHLLRQGTFYDAEGEVLDHGMYVEMLGPRSYTGEDVVELHVHGSAPIVQAVIERTKALGARLAAPGEFTLRAFVNGRMTLDQAEGVADLIAASNESDARLAARLVRGSLRGWVDGLLEELEGVLVRGQAAVDFPEHATGEGWVEADFGVVRRVRENIQGLLARGRTEVQRRRSVVLCGAPNAGKSTLVNALAGERRVLVDDAPGTTRDPVETEIRWGRQSWRVIDTAGIREGAVGLEAEGIRMAHDRASRGDVVVWLLDPGNPCWPPQDLPVDLIVGGKADLAWHAEREGLEDAARRRGLMISGWLSGVDLGDPVAAMAILTGSAAGVDSGEVSVVRQRHLDALAEADAALGDLLAAARGASGTMDVLLMELERATRALGAILGRDADAEVLERIFREFCIGK